MQGIHHGHRAGQSPLDLPVGQLAQELRILYEHGALRSTAPATLGTLAL